MDRIKAYFDNFIHLPKAEWDAFKTCFSRTEISKKEMVLEEGNRCDFIAFIEKGAFRFYYLKEGNELVTAFFFAGDFLSNYRSYLTGQPSNHFIQALEDSVIWVVHKPDLDRLYDQYPLIERTGRLVAERLFLAVTQRLDSLLYETPEERYLKLLQRGSALLHNVPQYMLASYLGITPESLSRIRKRITL